MLQSQLLAQVSDESQPATCGGSFNSDKSG